MDGKYAKYIPSSYGFITGLSIEDNELHVYTKKTVKGEPHKYLLANKYTEYSGRLENQYRLITDEGNLQLIRSDLIKGIKSKLNNILLALLAPTSVAACIATFILEAALPLIAGIGIVIALLISKKMILSKTIKDFDEEMDIIKAYLESRHDIEEMSTKDLNVTGNLKSATISRIGVNQELHKNNLIPDVFDITLLDDLISQQKTKAELKKLLTNYMICVSLEKPQVFVNPNEEVEQQLADCSKHEDVEQEGFVESKNAPTRGLRPNNK